VRRLLAAELLRARTTRTAFGLTLGLLAISAIAAAGTVASAGESELSSVDFQQDLPLTAGFATLFALLFGIFAVTAEYRHGTATPTFLVTPVRERVIAAKALASALVGLGLATLALGLAYAIATPWLSARGASLDLLEGESGRRIVGLLLAAALWGALGAGIGAAVRNQVAAIVGALAWFLVAEPLLGVLWSDIGPYLPGAAIDGVLRSDGDDELGFGGAVALSLAYALGACVLGAVLTARRDIR